MTFKHLMDAAKSSWNVMSNASVLLAVLAGGGNQRDMERGPHSRRDGRQRRPRPPAPSGHRQGSAGSTSQQNLNELSA